MSNQEPLHTSGAVNGAVFRRPTIVKKKKGQLLSNATL